ncbi:hypothetical protein NKH95_32980 [Mesorhizobium sp. M0848]|uniref:hypothetical protein n=1 Tax=Mesorhizobium sp. M0848 TaxID=2957012 RepID=UPI00333B5293
MTELKEREPVGNVTEGILEFDGKRYLGGRASDPRNLGWMRGSPPRQKSVYRWKEMLS